MINIFGQIWIKGLIQMKIINKTKRDLRIDLYSLKKVFNQAISLSLDMRRIDVFLNKKQKL